MKTYRCAICRVQLAEGDWIYSSRTGDRYCPPRLWAQCENRSVDGKQKAPMPQRDKAGRFLPDAQVPKTKTRKPKEVKA